MRRWAWTTWTRLAAGVVIGLAACQGGRAPTQPAPAATQPPAHASAVPGETLAPAPALTEPAATAASTEPAASPTPAYDPFAAELPVAGQAYVLPLTVRHVLEDRAVLLFELDQPADGALFYQAQTSGAPVQSIPFPAGQARQQIQLEGLQPGVEYQALVGLDDGAGGYRQPAFLENGWGRVRFRTNSGQAPLRVGVFGDASFGDPDTAALVAEMANRSLDFVIHAGDVVDKIEDDPSPAAAYARKFYQTLSPLLHTLPVYTIIGNHDYDQTAWWEGNPFYYYAFPAFPDPQFEPSEREGRNQYYAFAVQGVQFLMLDSQAIYGAGGREEQQAWLEQRLADPRFKTSIPVLHVPPFFSGEVHPEDQTAIRQTWHGLFAASRVPLVLSGHSHHYERLQADGITYLVSGGGSGTLYGPGQILPESQLFASRTHFVLLEFYPDRIELSAIAQDGEKFDQAVVPLE